MRLIRTEDPAVEQWRMLSQFSYGSNVEKILRARGVERVDPVLTDFVGGCFRQAAVYCETVSRTPLDISPLLAYYGATNLLAGASAILNGAKPAIDNHGMRLVSPETGARIADGKVAANSNHRGGLEVFSKALEPGWRHPAQCEWSVQDVVGSILELREDVEACYPTSRTYVLPVEVVQHHGVLVDRIQVAHVRGYPKPLQAVMLVEGFRRAYLPPQGTADGPYLVLYRKQGAAEIGYYSATGEKFLLIPHEMRGQRTTAPPAVTLLLGLFALGNLSRYQPEFWNRFVRTDESGERGLIERFLAVAMRALPNIVLNSLLGDRIEFVYGMKQPANLTKELEALVNSAVERQLRQRVEE